MTRKGTILNIQKFSIHDGPGIRTTIFMKGCSLKCRWCHNPESISHKIQLNFNRSKCNLCGKCVEFVKGNGINISNHRLVIDFIKHDTNMDLIEVCPNKAYSRYGILMDVEQVVEEVLKDKDYYDESGGGVTFSGGEAINQLDFIKKVAKELHSHNIKSYLDVSGFDPFNKIETTLSWIDGYLLDYKLAKDSKYTSLVGHSLHFSQVIHILNTNKKDIILRCPIIPTINDDEFHFQSIAEVSNSYSITRVEILPYHNLKKKMEFLYSNEVEEFSIPSNEDISRWRAILHKHSSRNTYINNKLI